MVSGRDLTQDHLFGMVLRENKGVFLGKKLINMSFTLKSIIKKLETVGIVSVSDYLSAKKKVLVDDLELSTEEIESISIAVDKFIDDNKPVEESAEEEAPAEEPVEEAPVEENN